MELRHLEYFAAVASDRSFSRAAQRIHVAQSALSAAINKLERELGVELFDRTKRPVELTRPGVEFLRHAREVIHASQRARASVQSFRGELTGTVTLGTMTSWGSLDLAAALATYRALHPAVTLRLRQSASGSAGHLAAIADGELDVALVAARPPGPPFVRLLQLTVEPMVVLLPPGHPLAEREGIDVADLLGIDLIQFPLGWGIRELVDAAFASTGGEPSTVYEVADYTIATQLVRRGLAVVILPGDVAGWYADLPSVVIPTLDWVLSIACTPQSHANPATNALMDILIRQAGLDPGP